MGPARPASPMFVAHRPWRTSTADALTFSSDALTPGGRFDFRIGRFDPDTLAIGRFDQPPSEMSMFWETPWPVQNSGGHGTKNTHFLASDLQNVRNPNGRAHGLFG